MSPGAEAPVATIASSDTLQPPAPSLRGQTDVCSLSGGSDLPGTVVHFEVTGSASGSEDLTLPDFGEGLIAGLEGLPEAGSQVEPGDRIKVHAIAFLFPPALGVKTLYVDDGSDLLESVGNLSGSDQPVACDPRRVKAELVTEYDVPADAPPVIELCATGLGFDGTESKNCIQYCTGEVWKGTASITSSAVYPEGSATCQDGWELEFTFVASAEGTISGQGSAELASGPTCTFPFNDVPFGCPRRVPGTWGGDRGWLLTSIRARDLGVSERRGNLGRLLLDLQRPGIAFGRATGCRRRLRDERNRSGYVAVPIDRDVLGERDDRGRVPDVRGGRRLTRCPLGWRLPRDIGLRPSGSRHLSRPTTPPTLPPIRTTPYDLASALERRSAG